MKAGRCSTREASLFVAACLMLGLPRVAAAEPAAPEQHPSSGKHASGAVGSHATGAPTQVSAIGSRPVVVSDGAHATSATTASVEGNADPEGALTRLHVAYAVAKERWCTSNGAKGVPAAKSASLNLGSGHGMLSEIAVKLEGLTPGVEYCADLVATNRFGTSHSRQIRFTTPDEGAQSAASRPSGPTQAPSRTSRPSSSTQVTPAESRPSRPTQSSPTQSSRGWPTAAIITVAVLGVLLLGGLAVVARPRLRARRQGSARPAAG
jgi:hypothetical protein